MRASQRPERKRTIEMVERELDRLRYERDTLLEIEETLQEEEEEQDRENNEDFERNWIGPGELQYLDCNAGHDAKLAEATARRDFKLLRRDFLSDERDAQIGTKMPAPFRSRAKRR